MIKVRTKLYGKQKTVGFDTEQQAYEHIKTQTNLSAVYSVFIKGEQVNATSFYYRVEREIREADPARL